MKAEAERLSREAEALSEAANKAQNDYGSTSNKDCGNHYKGC